MMDTSSAVAVQGALLMVQRSTYVPTEVIPVTVVVGEDGVVMVGVEGPLMKLHAPVPVVAVFPANVAEPLVAQMFWSAPAFATVGGALTMIETFDVEAVQGALLIVQRRL